ncbi:unnamed protein product [Lepidochelys kempii]
MAQHMQCTNIEDFEMCKLAFDHSKAMEFIPAIDQQSPRSHSHAEQMPYKVFAHWIIKYLYSTYR